MKKGVGASCLDWALVVVSKPSLQNYQNKSVHVLFQPGLVISPNPRPCLEGVLLHGFLLKAKITSKNGYEQDTL